MDSVRLLDEFPAKRLQALAVEIFDELRRMSFDGVGVTREWFGRLETDNLLLATRVLAQALPDVDRTATV
ncbi:MAG: hypothetical protein ACT4PS_06555 [Betaproteobacteria bacterium]